MPVREVQGLKLPVLLPRLLEPILSQNGTRQSGVPNVAFQRKGRGRGEGHSYIGIFEVDGGVASSVSGEGSDQVEYLRLGQRGGGRQKGSKEIRN